MSHELDQGQFRVRMEWGIHGAAVASRTADYVVIVDVLSFTTTVSVALDQGIEVFPYSWRDQSAADFARRHRAVLAVGRSGAAAGAGAPVTPEGNGQPCPVSLSPASIRVACGVDRIVLPSPNGSALASALRTPGETARQQILAASLRNRAAVATWLTRQPDQPGRQNGQPAGHKIITVIAAGERWPDGSLRPAAEDLWGAGAVIAVLESLGLTGLSPEARSAAAAWHAIEPALSSALASCSSGAELVAAGFGKDVAIAAELDSSATVPLLSSQRFIDAAHTLGPRAMHWPPDCG